MPQDFLLLVSRGAKDGDVGLAVLPDVCAKVHVAHPFLPLPEEVPFLPGSTELCKQRSKYKYLPLVHLSEQKGDGLGTEKRNKDIL